MTHSSWLNIVLYQPEIPQNTGNIGRTCVALNMKLWIVRPAGFRLDSAHLKRSGMDYWNALDLQVVDSWQEMCTHLPTNRFWLFSKFGTKGYTDATFAPGDVLVFGSESSGLPDSIHQAHAQRVLQIPMIGPTRSLNLAVSVGVAAYEAYRQLAPQLNFQTQLFSRSTP